jgi:hypothetical protein
MTMAKLGLGGPPIKVNRHLWIAFATKSSRAYEYP